MSDIKLERFNIVAFDQEKKPSVRDFALKTLHQVDGKILSDIKQKYSPLSQARVEVKMQKQKDRRFSLDPLLRDPLSVGEEEQQVIAEKVRVQVEALSQTVNASAAEAGFQEGLKKGRLESFERFKEESRENLEKFEKMLAAAEAAKEDIFRANEQFLIELIFRVARSIILKELSTDADYVLRLVTELIAKVDLRESVTVRIHPSEGKTLESLKGGLETAFGSLKNLKIEYSDQVMRGGCQVETQWNVIDASIESQLQAVYGALLG